MSKTDLVCSTCGAGPEDLWETEPSRSVKLGSSSKLWEKQPTEISVLDRTVLCDECSEGIEDLRRSAMRSQLILTLNRPDAIKLIAQVRRAPAKDQLDVLDWLLKKYPKHRLG